MALIWFRGMSAFLIIAMMRGNRRSLCLNYEKIDKSVLSSGSNSCFDLCEEFLGNTSVMAELGFVCNVWWF